MEILAILLLLLAAAGTPNAQEGLFPPAHININLGEDRPVTATSVCAEDNCKSSLINDGDDETRWQSVTGVSDVNVTVDLQGERRITFISMRFKSSIPYGLIIYYSTDGTAFSPRQYFARDCSIFGLSNNSALQGFSDVNCISKSIFQYPFNNQLVEFALIGSGTRPNADTIDDLNQHPELQQFAQASHVRIQLFGWHPEQSTDDQYFAVSELLLSGQGCICNGHSSSCNDNACVCQHNTTGDHCEQCLPLFNNQEWKAGTVSLANPCVECECNNHSSSCVYNETLNQGICVDCQYETTGYNCEECIPYFYHPSSIPIDSVDRCQPCNCNISGIADDDDCKRSDNQDGTDSGNCTCLSNVGGRDCSVCIDGFYGFSSIAGCVTCGCDIDGSMNAVCDKATGQCDCLQGIGGRNCSYCEMGFYGFGDPNGCQACNEQCVDCFGGSAKECMECANFLSSDSQTCVSSCQVDEFYDSKNHCLNCNLQCLEFVETSVEVNISEKLSVGSVIHQVNITDKRKLESRVFEYGITSGNTGKKFFINSTGTISIADSLDFEKTSSYVLTVVVTDADPKSSESAETTIAINILDNNDNAPAFSKQEYFVQIKEDVDINTTIINLNATDSDSGSNALLQFAILSGSELFGIRPATGEVFTLSELDYEQQTEHIVYVQARDQGNPSLSTAVNLTVMLANVNDERPIFNAPSYSSSVSEAAIPEITVVLTVNASDVDTPHIDLTYEIFGTSSFSIDPSGTIFPAHELDYETTNLYMFDVVVSDGTMNTDPLGTSLVTIVVTDVNDNPPKFSYSNDTISDAASYNFTVAENVANSAFGTVKALDADNQENGEVSYHLLSGNMEHFKVNSATGEVTVTNALDREDDMEEYTLIILAKDEGSPSLNATVNVYVTVLDKNDNAPHFQRDVYEVVLREDYSLMSTFLTIEANDSDTSDVNSNVFYSISSEESHVIFQVNSSSGALSLVAPLDAETELLHVINMTARDTGIPPLSSSVPVYVIVTNVNDNEIEVQLSLASVQFIEQGDAVHVFPGVTVVDNDEDSIVVNATVSITSCLDCQERLIFNGDINLFANATLDVNVNETEFLFTGAFTIDEITNILGNIQYHNTLEELNAANQYVYLTVSDGLYVSENTVEVDLIGINNHAPVVDLNSLDGNKIFDYSIQFTEDSEGIPITLNPSITDGDRGLSLLESIQIQITIPYDDPEEFLTATSSDDVSVFPESGGTLITLIGPADISYFEYVLSTVRYHNNEDNPYVFSVRTIEVIADDGEVFKSSPSYTTVTIQAVNDPPVLMLGLDINSTVTYVEDSPSVLLAPNSQLSDPDSSTLQEISFELTEYWDDGFEYLLLPVTAGLKVAETSPTYLTLSGTDTIAAYLSVVRNARYINNASEPTEGERIISVIINDDDEAAEAFVLVNVSLRNDPPVVSVDQESITFVENGPAVSVFPGLVQITDSDNAVLSSIEVKIINAFDKNDEYLFWNGSSDFTVTGNMNHTLTISGNFTADTFAATLSFIYYTNTADMPSSTQREVRLLANDGSQDSTPVYINLKIQLVNLSPVILLDSFGNSLKNVLYIEESESVSVIDTAASITDEDTTFLSHMEVSLSPVLDDGQESIVFSNISDSLIVHSMYDQFSSKLHYNFSFPFAVQTSVFEQLLHSLKYQNTASEPDNSLSRTIVITIYDYIDYSDPAIITINITLVNDNQPKFLNSSYDFSVPENTPLNSIVGTVEALDADQDSGEFYYIILTENVPFVVDESSGEVRTSELLDRESRSEYELNMRLSISLDPISLFASQATVHIIISDVNEAPVFTKSKYEFTVFENITMNTKFGSVIAEDPDSDGNNGILNFTVSSEFIGVEMDTGTLFTTALLDRESTPSLTVIVTVADKGDKPLSATAEVQLTIADINDNSPIFSKPQYQVQLIDDVAISTIILIVFAKDLDLGVNAEISYSLLNADSIPFNISETTGIVSTTQLLSPGNFLVTVVAEDNGSPSLNGTAFISIDVYNSTNTSLLRFSQSVYMSSIVENSENGTYLVTVSAADPIFNSNLTYSLDSEAFLIDSSSGEVFTNQVFDREIKSFFEATVTATSSDNLQSTAELVVYVTDENDNPPVFSSQVYNFSVEEGSEIGDVVGLISATDELDKGDNAVVMGYTIDSNDFSIDNNGTITVSSILDRELNGSYAFNAFASDGGNVSLTSTTQVSITIEDINDNAPSFTQDKYFGSVNEKESSAFVLNVKAVDADLGENARITYTIDSPFFSIDSPFFSIDANTGDISTKIELEFEVQQIYNFNATATDNGNESLSSSASVEIKVLSIVDTNPPEFNETEYEIVMEEELPPSTHVVKVTAHTNNSATIVYSIVEGTDSVYFNIISDSGDIFIVSSLDRERSNSYSINISARSTSNDLSSKTTVVIKLTDINDNSPIFRNDSTSFTVYENVSIGTEVGQVEAYDIDEGENATIGGFSLINGTDLFSINSSSGEISFSGSSIDREMNDTVLLLVTAHDMGNPQRTGTTIIVITILDINDNPPVFERNYVVSIPEDTLPNTLILTLNATDADEEKYSVVEYMLLTDSPFAVNKTNGQLRLVSELDYETRKVYQLSVTAVDKRNPLFLDTAIVTVNVLDSDDLPPYFDPSVYVTNVIENSLNTPFTQVFAHDDDTVHKVPITYSILSENTPFTIDSVSGHLSVKTPLDRELQETYTIIVQAEGHPSPPATASVMITVTDINDFTPTFASEQYNFIISESSPVDTSIGMLMVFDEDLGDNGDIISIFLQNSSSTFTMNNTLTLFLNGELDYEQTTYYILTVLAIDGGNPSLTGSTTIIVSVTDENDNAPDILTNITEFHISEDTELLTIITTIEAVDLDSGDNGMIEFSLASEQLPVAVNTSTGEVFTTDTLIPGNYSVTVTVSDQGTPVKTASVNLTVFVTDVNLKPVIASGIDNVTVLESKQIGAKVTTVVAMDPDGGMNAVLMYYLSNTDYFIINVTTGEVTLLKMLDREIIDSFDLVVFVVDSGEPPSTASASLRITVGDVNDNAPVFSQPGGYSVSISEDAGVGTTIITMNVTDADAGSNSALTFALTFIDISQSSLIGIDDLGAITIKQPLDREMFESIEVIVRAFDGGGLSTSVTLIITILDYDDNPPMFTDLPDSIAVIENVTVGTYLLNVSAEDPDLGNNGIVRYKIVSDIDIPFSINSETGTTTVADPGLDREVDASYLLTIEAFNPLSDIFTATATVNIEVIDINDNPPVFIPSNFFSFDVKENSSTGDIIGSIVSNDSDEGSNAELTYSFASASENDYISIDSDSGELMLAEQFDYEKDVTSLRLKVIVEDNGEPSLSSNATLVINVINVNDNPPFINTSDNYFSYTEESLPIDVGQGIFVADEDNLTISTATVQLTLQDTKDFISLGNFSSSLPFLEQSNEHTINIIGPASTEAFTNALRYIQFGSNSSEPSGTTRVIAVQLNDGLYDSNRLNIFVEIKFINDNAPVIDFSLGGNASVDYTEDEDDMLLIVPESTSIFDMDSGSNVIVNGSATLLVSPKNASESLSAVSRGKVTVYNESPLKVTFIGESTLNGFVAALKTLTYTVTDDNPLSISTTRIVELVVNDGVFYSPPSYIHITIIPSNDPPLLLIENQILNYTEQNSFLPVFSNNLTLIDVDSLDLAYVDVNLVDQVKNIEELTYNISSTNITVQVNGSKLRFVGPASLGDFTNVLLSLQYSNTDIDSPDIVGSKRIQVTLFDGIDFSDVNEIIITFSSFNDPPIVDLDGDESLELDNTVLFYEEGEAVLIAPQGTVVDLDSSSIASAVIELVNRPDAEHELLLLSFNTTLEHDYNVSTGELKIFGEAGADIYQQLLRSVLYNNTDSNPSTQDRTVSVTVSDKESAASSLVYSTVKVIDINDPPELSVNETNAVFIEGAAAVGFISAAKISDVDNDEFASIHVNILNAEDIDFEGIKETLNDDSVSVNIKELYQYSCILQQCLQTP